ncbi:hypothetical protein BHE74_00054037 [Ensete ventricosum]|nr:hypothetical protein BHE74_00054037 [Ensete ventricosum]
MRWKMASPKVAITGWKMAVDMGCPGWGLISVGRQWLTMPSPMDVQLGATTRCRGGSDDGCAWKIARPGSDNYHVLRMHAVGKRGQQRHLQQRQAE